MAALSEDRFTDAHVQAVAKARRDGIDALDDEERARYDEIAEIVGRSMASTTPEQRRAYSEAMDAYDRMSSADQLRYEDWTPEQLLAFLPLLNLEGPA